MIVKCCHKGKDHKINLYEDKLTSREEREEETAAHAKFLDPNTLMKYHTHYREDRVKEKEKIGVFPSREICFLP